MRLHTTAALAALFLGALPVVATAQITFANSTSKLAVATFHSGVGISVLDMDGDGMDDIARMDQGTQLKIEKQRTGQQFQTVTGVSMGGSSAWSMVVGDVDGNGYRDVIAGFGSGATLSKANATGTAYGATVSLPSSNFFLQNMNCMDVDNDGDIDIMGCNDNGESKIWVNNGSGTYTVSNIINFDVSATDDSGNYGSIWSDFDNDGDVDLYIAKCRQGVSSSTDARRINVLFVNNGNGTYTEKAGIYGLRIGAQSWTANFEDINNDGWFDVLVTNHDVPNMMMLNDGTGHFSDINVNNAAGLNINHTPYQSKMADFDNDGFVDVLITGTNYSPTSARLFRNNGDNTFSPVAEAFPGGNTIQSFGVGDLNHDGKLDVYAGYATGYTTPSNINDVLWLNNTANTNHFISFTLRGTVSNRDALGARMFIYGAWGVQTREVRAGEGYGNCNSFNLHFGLGSATVVDSAVIRWPAGGTTRLFNKPADQFITVVENQCTTPNNIVSTVGSPVLCTGQTVTLAAATGTGYTYLWSNGATTATTQVSSAGEYSVKVTVPGGCSSVSPIINVQVTPDQTPAIVAAGETKFCEGGSVMLQGPADMDGYHWSNGATTQNVEITESGTYTLTIDGSCQQFTSTPVTVEVLASPAPTGTDATIVNSGSVTLTATGNQVEWFTAPTGGTAIHAGNTFTTPVLTANTTYYIRSTTDYAGDVAQTGQTNHSGSSLYSGTTTNATTSFTVSANCKLASVKVYTETAGERLIQVKDNGGNVVASALVNIPNTASLPGASARIDLNFNLTPGTYTIGTDAATNTANFGLVGPQLRRSNGGGVSYPYTVPNVLSITGSSEGNTLFYYFYDWSVESGSYSCPSGRVPVNVFVVSDAGIGESAAAAGISVFPNPTEGMLHIKTTQAGINGATLKVLDVTGKTVYTERTVNMQQNAVKSIDVSQLAAGVYTLELSNGEMRHNVKFIVR